jgi:hypothetical protein
MGRRFGRVELYDRSSTPIATTAFRRRRCSGPRKGLATLGLPVEWHLSADIDAEGLRHGGEFLAPRFAAQWPILS